MPRPPRRPPSARPPNAGPAAARARFVCSGCGLDFPERRAAHPHVPPLRCLCCAFLLTVPDAQAREALRRVMARLNLQRRFGGRGAPPAVPAPTAS